MKSLGPKDYESLPALESPGGYVCVIRDIDRDLYRIEATRSPKALVDAVVSEEQRNFGIELVALLQTDDLAASEAALYAQHHARLSSEWLELDAHQLEELRQSALQIDAYASRYLTSANPALDQAAASDAPDDPAAHSPFRVYSRIYMPDRGRWKRRRSREPIPDIRYGAGALRRSRRAENLQRAESLYQLSAEDQIKELIGDFIVNHIIKITALAFALFFLLLAYVIFSNNN